MRLPPYDKCLHFLVGQLVAFVMLVLLGLPWSLGMVAFVAIGKEVWDHYNPPHTPDVWDTVATMCGGVPVWALWFMRQA